MTELIAIGKITNTHGHKGEVRVLPLTDFPERFKKTKQVNLLLNEELVIYNIETVRNHKNLVIVKFKEIADMNEAIRLKGAIIQVPEEDLVPLPEGHFYIYQIIGLEVYTTEGNYLGNVSDIITTGGNDVYIVKNKVNKELLIPAIKDVIRDINLEDKKITVKLLEGMEA